MKNTRGEVCGFGIHYTAVAWMINLHRDVCMYVGGKRRRWWVSGAHGCKYVCCRRSFNMKNSKPLYLCTHAELFMPVRSLCCFFVLLVVDLCFSLCWFHVMMAVMFVFQCWNVKGVGLVSKRA